MAEPMCAPMDHGSEAGRSEGLERRRQLVQRDPELGVRAAGGQVRVRVGVEAGIDPQADPTGTPCRDQRRERTERLGVDEGARCQRRGEVAIGLSHAVDHDPFGRAAGAQGERQLDRPDDLEPEAVGRQSTQQRRIGVGLDGVGDQRSGERVSPGIERRTKRRRDR